MSEKEPLDQLKLEIDQLQSAISQLSGQLKDSSTTRLQCATCFPQQGCTSTPTNPSQPYLVPDFNIPLISPGGGDTDCEIQEKLGPLAGLLGTWVSTRYAGYNVMPLPQATADTGIILKNMSYYEVTTFSAIQGKVANRQGTFEQDAYTIFYSQRVFFAEGPQKDQLIHAENGAWLHQVMGPQGEGQLNGPCEIPSPPAPAVIIPQNPQTEIVKQVSVPHGNSILALGSWREICGAPQIPQANTIPEKASREIAALFGQNCPTNPNVNPNIVLQLALDQLLANGITVDNTIELSVNTAPAGDVANTPFMKQNSNVPAFSNTFWLQHLSNGSQQLQYTQDITLEFPQLADAKSAKLQFPHVTANTLFKVQ